MSHDDLRIVKIQSQEISRMFGDKAVRGSVKTVSSHFVFLIIFIRKSVQISFLRHGLMESSIKYGNHGSFRHQFLAGTDSDQVSRIVQRRQIVAFFDCRHHFVIDHNRGSKFFSAVYHAMSYCIHFIQTLDHACLGIHQRIQHHLNRLFVGGHICLCFFFFAACRLVHQSAVDSDTLAQPLCQYVLCVGIDQLEFQRRASAVNY